MPAPAGEIARTVVAWSRRLSPEEALRTLDLVHRVLQLALGSSYARAVRHAVEGDPGFVGRAGVEPKQRPEYHSEDGNGDG